MTEGNEHKPREIKWQQVTNRSLAKLSGNEQTHREIKWQKVTNRNLVK